MQIRPLPLLTVLLLSALPAARASVTTEAADAALRAHRNGDPKALIALATTADGPDPWLVAEELLVRGERDAARAVATAADRPDLTGLATWLDKQARYPADPAARAAAERALDLLREGKAQEALDAVQNLPTTVADITSVRLLTTRGKALARLGRRNQAIPVFVRAAEIAAKLGWLRRAARAYELATGRALEEGTPVLAVTYGRKRLEIETKRENPDGRIAALTDLARALTDHTQYDLAERRLREARELATAEKTLSGAARIELIHGEIALARGLLDAASRHYERSLAMASKPGDGAERAGSLAGLARVWRARGNPVKAMELAEQAQEIWNSLGRKRERATVLVDLGNIYRELGMNERSLLQLKLATKLFFEVKAKNGLAMALTNLAVTFSTLRQPERAIRTYEEALVVTREIGDSYGTALILGNLGELLVHARQLDRAKKLLNESMKLRAEIGDRRGVGVALGNLGLAHAFAKDQKLALETLKKALAISEEYGPLDAAARQSWSIAGARMQLGQNSECAAAARRTLAILSELYRQIGPKEAAGQRSRWSGVYGLGLRAAVDGDDPAEAFFFIEAARADAQVRALGGGITLASANLPKDLQNAVTTALVEEANARKAFEGALTARRVAAIEYTQKQYRAKRTAMLAAIERLRTEQPLIADLLFPKPRALAEVQSRLDAGTAIVLYDRTLEFVLGLVITGKDIRIVHLGPTAELDRICTATDFSDELELIDLEAATAPVRRKLVAPLTLGDDIRRVLLSPAGSMSRVPWSAVLPEMAITHIPSATAWADARGADLPRGRGILAVGRGKRASAEAKAVGDTTQLGGTPAPAGLGRPPQGGRWRAVHIASPAVLSNAGPVHSFVALAPGKGDDGRLLIRDLLPPGLSADLVSFSRLTSEGGGPNTSGREGFVRILALAGAPRVLVGLWRADDEATFEFVKEFYRLWRPTDGRPALPATEALQRAQAHVRSRDGWSHPYYWAGWQLWGLAD